MIRQAIASESSILTKIAFASKRYWNYPEEYIAIWQEELTVTEEYLAQNDVFVYEEDGRRSAFYSIIQRDSDLTFKGDVIPKGVWLDHMFVDPHRIGTGIGSELFRHMLSTVSEYKIDLINIFCDPNAKGFYAKMGCELVREFPSTIPGRNTPYMVFRLNYLNYLND